MSTALTADSIPVEASSPYLTVKDLRVGFDTRDGRVNAVNGLSFQLHRGKTLGIVGESGSGKSVASLALLGLHQQRGAAVSGEVWIDGVDIVSAPADRVRRMRGQKMAMIFQDPLTALHPYFSIGSQIIEAYRLHNKVSRRVARAHAVDMLGRVGIPSPATRINDFPHQFSGGMRQRAMIAMALSCSPELLIADEPTTALDVTVQAQILELILELQQEVNSAVILITHDLGVVAETADDILVMYAGKPLEYASTAALFDRPDHPYSWGLLSSLPRMDRNTDLDLVPVDGSPPSLIHVPSGCVFHTRCRYRSRVGAACENEVPEFQAQSGVHSAACHIPAAARQAIWRDEVRPTL